MEVVKKQSDRHKMVRCKICSKNIRSDNVKRHQRTHKDLLVLSEEEVREELRARQEVAVEREQKIQKIEEIAQQEGIPLDLCTDATGPSTSSIPSDIELENFLLQQNRLYKDKVALGRRVAKILNKGIVFQEALPKEHKDALDIYQKQKSRVDQA